MLMVEPGPPQAELLQVSVILNAGAGSISAFWRSACTAPPKPKLYLTPRQGACNAHRRWQVTSHGSKLLPGIRQCRYQLQCDAIPEDDGTLVILWLPEELVFPTPPGLTRR